jgi:hypothetical protein
MLKVFEKEKLVYEYEKQPTSERITIIFNLLNLDFKRLVLIKNGEYYKVSPKRIG